MRRRTRSPRRPRTTPWLPPAGAPGRMATEATRAGARFGADRRPGAEQRPLPVAVRRGAREPEESPRFAAQEAPRGRRAGRTWATLRQKSAWRLYGRVHL